MDYNKYDCPVCERPLVEGDDIVVCPECGAPHHRKCYEVEHRCAFESQHGENFDYEQYRKSQQSEDEAQNEADAVTCPRCGAECPKGSFYCNKCGFPIGMGNQQQAQNNGAPQGGFYGSGPFGAGAQFTQNFDPMVGINPEEDWGDGVTAGEISKYVQKNTLYFMRVFNNIKKFFKSRFNFVAFLISVPYLMYRKMYKIGTIIAIIFFSLLIVETLIANSPAYVAFGNAVEQVSAQSTSLLYNAGMYDAFFSMSIENQTAIGIMMLCSMARFALQIIVGAKANKWYFKHCINQVAQIKTQDNAQQALESSGGVNLAIAISMYAIYIIINFVPIFIG
ncbi:MAG: hypothetical protein J1E96_05575 [Ruminococcus sp.]|nr:hypothetical protein [Ruminococcus sp.]